VASDVSQDLQGISAADGEVKSQQTRTLAFNPSLQMASQSSLDCSDAAGEVNSICRIY
jgi:hypothetical protein